VAKSGEVPLYAAGDPRPPQRYQPGLDDVVVVDEIEVVVCLVERGQDPAAKVRKDEDLEILVFHDYDSVLLCFDDVLQVGLHRVRVDLLVPQRRVGIVRAEVVGGNLDPGFFHVDLADCIRAADGKRYDRDKKDKTDLRSQLLPSLGFLSLGYHMAQTFFMPSMFGVAKASDPPYSIVICCHASG